MNRFHRERATTKFRVGFSLPDPIVSGGEDTHFMDSWAAPCGMANEQRNIVTMELAAPLEWRSAPRAEDEAAVRRVIESTGFFHPFEVEIAVELVQERLTKGPASGYEFVFVEQAGVVLGYACYGLIGCTEGSYDLYWIAVDSQHQGRGLGRQLLKQAEQAIRQRQGRRIYIETSNRPLYQSTRGFYEKSGYREEAVLKDFYAPGDDKVIYGKALT